MVEGVYKFTHTNIYWKRIYHKICFHKMIPSKPYPKFMSVLLSMQLTNENNCLVFTVTKEMDVQDAKPGLVQVYDYYDKGMMKRLDLYS